MNNAEDFLELMLSEEPINWNKDTDEIKAIISSLSSRTQGRSKLIRRVKEEQYNTTKKQLGGNNE